MKDDLIGNDRARHLQKLDSARACDPLEHVHYVTIHREGQDQFRIEAIKGAFDGLCHAADHFQRDTALEAAKRAAAHDDFITAAFAETLPRNASRITVPHEVIELID